MDRITVRTAKSVFWINGTGIRQKTGYPAKDQIFGKRSDIWQKTRYPAKDRISGPTPLPKNLQKVRVHVWEEAGEALEYFSVGLG